MRILDKHQNLLITIAIVALVILISLTGIIFEKIMDYYYESKFNKFVYKGAIEFQDKDDSSNNFSIDARIIMYRDKKTNKICSLIIHNKDNLIRVK